MSTNKQGLKYAESVLSDASGNAAGGFNSRLMGYNYAQTMDGAKWDVGARASGWNLADRMVREGKLYAVHNFHHSHECSGDAFPYGGEFVCNACDKPRIQKDWWTVKCYADGNAWCCVGTGFENLQESSNYAFGDTYDAAIKAYGDLMVAQSITSA